MTILSLLLQAVTLGATNVGAHGPMTTPRGRPSFADEFQGSAVDERKWRLDTRRNARGWFNREQQYYGPHNARVDRGVLTIEARREAPRRARDWGGQRYTSARLVTRASFGFGFYEVRAKLPCGRGMWPAIWLLPASGVWPDEGEIDMMEMVGWDAHVIHATLHTSAFNHHRGNQRGALIRVATSCTQFHRFQLDWRPHSITIGVDGRAYMRVRDDQPGGTAAWPFVRPFQLILNLAVGGDWGGRQGIDDSALPQFMRVDYVRIWTRVSAGRVSPGLSHRR